MRNTRIIFTFCLLALAQSVTVLLANDTMGDASHGRTLFQQSCALCHAAGAGMKGGQGPSLVGVIGRKAAAVPNFDYSKALKESGLSWDATTLDRYLINPAVAVPGTRMVVQVPQEDARRDIIAYLSTVRFPAAPTFGAGRGWAPELNASDTNDWRSQKPGRNYFISADRLPAPYSTSTPGNFPMVVPQPTNAELEVPLGFKVELFTNGLENGRIIHVAPNGDIFVAETSANRIRVLRAPDGATSPTENEVFAAELDRPFGIAFYPSGPEPQWIYVANNNSVVRFPYRNGDLKARGSAETIVAKLSDTTNGHTTRDIAFSKDGERLFISVGSSGNLAEGMPVKTPDDIKQWEKENAFGAAWEADMHRANVLVTSPDGREAIKIFATGIRNPVSLAVNPITGELWTSVNERDGLGDDLVPDYVTRVGEGAFYGWPWS